MEPDEIRSDCDFEHVIVYCSPAGSTRHVAAVIEKEINGLGKTAVTCDIGKERSWEPILEQIRTKATVEDRFCLFIGSPVYVYHAVPPVLAFIDALPNVTLGYAVPFATWGCVTSGVALWEMARNLNDKGFGILGAAKVLSVHSRLWQSRHPIGRGHPDQSDDNTIKRFVRTISTCLTREKVQTLPLSVLDYQSENHRNMMKQTTVKTAKQGIPPRKIVSGKCTRCGICRETCPADAVTLAPYPVFGTDCFGCFNCVRLCPENAIEADLSGRQERLLQLMKIYNEKSGTQTFLPVFSEPL